MNRKRGEKLKIDRKKLELALARACMNSQDLYLKGIPKGTFCRAMGSKQIKPGTAGKIAKAIGCDITEIIETD